ncbi:MAG: hypothetical protein SNJ79_11635 [Sphingomonadaceae bacterium]
MHKEVTIAPPLMETAVFPIVGTAPLMIARFSKKAELMAKMSEGRAGGNKKKRDARNYAAEAEEAAYLAAEGWYGMNAAAFRNASISACRLVGFKMTMAKLALFVEADGFDERDGTPLVRIYGDPPEVNTMHTRNATGVVDVRARPMWRPGWRMNLKVRFDADQFTLADVTNLIARVGMQVGIGEGRPDSKSSAGLGFGLFRLETVSEASETGQGTPLA